MKVGCYNEIRVEVMSSMYSVYTDTLITISALQFFLLFPNSLFSSMIAYA